MGTRTTLIIRCTTPRSSASLRRLSDILIQLSRFSANCGQKKCYLALLIRGMPFCAVKTYPGDGIHLQRTVFLIVKPSIFPLKTTGIHRTPGWQHRMGAQGGMRFLKIPSRLIALNRKPPVGARYFRLRCSVVVGYAWLRDWPAGYSQFSGHPSTPAPESRHGQTTLPPRQICYLRPARTAPSAF